MAVDPLKFDNPLNTGNVDRDDFPIQFPARHEFDAVAVQKSGMVLLGVVLACVILAYIFVQARPDAAMAVAGITRLMVVILTVAVFVRWEIRSQVAFYATVAVSAICLFAASTSVFIDGSNRPVVAICTLAMLTLLWTAAEIAIHFQSIDVEVIRRDPAIADQRRQQNAGVLQFFAVVMGIAQCVALWTSMRLVAVPIAALFGAAIAYLLVAEIAKYPIKFLWLTIRHYVGYPESGSLVPGLIRSSASHPLVRLLPFVFVVATSALIALADRGTTYVLAKVSLMALCGLLAALTALLLGASLSARPIHFDVDRTPFDVVVSKLRDKVNENAK